MIRLVLGISKAELDDMSGTLHCEEGDYKTSFSYFLESYEAFDSQEDVRALRSLKVRYFANVYTIVVSTTCTLSKDVDNYDCCVDDDVYEICHEFGTSRAWIDSWMLAVLQEQRESTLSCHRTAARLASNV